MSNVFAISPTSMAKLVCLWRVQNLKTTSHIPKCFGTLLREQGARKPWWPAFCSVLETGRVRRPRRTYERRLLGVSEIRHKDFEWSKLTSAKEQRPWKVSKRPSTFKAIAVMCSDIFEDEAIRLAARNICHAYTDGSIASHLLIYLAV